MNKQASPLFLIENSELYFFPQVKDLGLFWSFASFMKKNVIRDCFQRRINKLVLDKPNSFITRLISLIFIHFFYKNSLFRLIIKSPYVVFFDNIVSPDIVFYTAVIRKKKSFIYTWNIIHDDLLNVWKKLIPEKNIVTYSQRDSLLYNLSYIRAPYVKTPIDCNLNNTIEYDVLFLGRLKPNRTTFLINILDSLYMCGLRIRADLLMTSNTKNEVSDRTYINYISSYMSYSEYLSNVIKSKCLLDIVYPENENSTFRTVESIFYNKKLITNNKLLYKESFFNKTNMFIFEVENIDTKAITDFISSNIDNYNSNDLNAFSLQTFITAFYKLI